MADISLTTAGDVTIVSGEMGDGNLAPPGVAGEAITAGAPVYRHATTGKYLNSDANGSGTDKVIGVALRTVVAGEPLTAAKGNAILGGYDLSGLNFGATVYVSNTVGRLADAAGGTSLAVGTVVPGLAVPAGDTSDKLLQLAL